MVGWWHMNWSSEYGKRIGLFQWDQFSSCVNSVRENLCNHSKNVKSHVFCIKKRKKNSFRGHYVSWAWVNKQAEQSCLTAHQSHFRILNAMKKLVNHSNNTVGSSQMTKKWPKSLNGWFQIASFLRNKSLVQFLQHLSVIWWRLNIN